MPPLASVRGGTGLAAVTNTYSSIAGSIAKYTLSRSELKVEFRKIEVRRVLIHQIIIVHG